MLIISGDDLAIPVALTEDGAPVDVSTATAIAAVFVDPVARAVVGSQVALDSASPGADWENGVVVAVFTAAQSADLSTFDKKALELEVQVTGVDGKKRTYIAPDFHVRTGLIV